MISNPKSFALKLLENLDRDDDSDDSIDVNTDMYDSVSEYFGTVSNRFESEDEKKYPSSRTYAWALMK